MIKIVFNNITINKIAYEKKEEFNLIVKKQFSNF